MREKILKNEADFLAWKDEECREGDEFNPPLKYPCLAMTEVSNWRWEEECAVYKYREDIIAILAELNGDIAP